MMYSLTTFSLLFSVFPSMILPAEEIAYFWVGLVKSMANILYSEFDQRIQEKLRAKEAGDDFSQNFNNEDSMSRELNDESSRNSNSSNTNKSNFYRNSSFIEIGDTEENLHNSYRGKKT